MRAALLLVLGASACADPVVELSLRVPPRDKGGDFNTSCVTAVDVYTVGPSYATGGNDFVRGCVEVDSKPATFAELRAALVGKIEVLLPDTGLAQVEMYGRRGPCVLDGVTSPGELVFYAGSTYIGQDELVLQMEAGASCDETPATVRLVDLVALTTGPTAGDCQAAYAAADDPGAGASIGTLTDTLTSGVVDFFGFAGANLTGGVATIPNALLRVGPASCLAVSSGDVTFGSVSCVDRAAPGACAGAGEIEAPGVPWAIQDSSIVQARLAEFPGVVFGAVVGADRRPIAGATVEIDTDHGDVFYVEPAGTKLAENGGTATGPSGLFMIYTDAIIPMTVTAGGLSRTAVVGALPLFPAATLVVLR